LRTHNLGITRSIREPARTQRRHRRLMAAALLAALVAGGLSAVLVALIAPLRATRLGHDDEETPPERGLGLSW
jgi:hypothetical protein